MLVLLLMLLRGRRQLICELPPQRPAAAAHVGEPPAVSSGTVTVRRMTKALLMLGPERCRAALTHAVLACVPSTPRLPPPPNPYSSASPGHLSHHGYLSSQNVSSAQPYSRSNSP